MHLDHPRNWKYTETSTIQQEKSTYIYKYRIDGKQLCGFNYGGIIMDEIIEIKDKEGIDMQDQFLTLKKSKNNAIG